MIMAVKRVSDLELVMRDSQITDYDRAHFLTYARILDAVRFDQAWQAAAIEILGLDVKGDEYGSYRIWHAHVDRAEWIVGDGLALIVQNSPVPDHLIH
jgi:hypothetical protein